MLRGPVRYIFAPIRLQGPVFTALPGCRATALPLKREVAPTPVVARLMAATSVQGSTKFVWGAVEGGTKGGTTNTALAPPLAERNVPKGGTARYGAVQRSRGQCVAERALSVFANKKA
jgi:hypothetical protein